MALRRLRHVPLPPCPPGSERAVELVRGFIAQQRRLERLRVERRERDLVEAARRVNGHQQRRAA